MANGAAAVTVTVAVTMNEAVALVVGCVGFAATIGLSCKKQVLQVQRALLKKKIFMKNCLVFQNFFLLQVKLCDISQHE